MASGEGSPDNLFCPCSAGHIENHCQFFVWKEKLRQCLCGSGNLHQCAFLKNTQRFVCSLNVTKLKEISQSTSKASPSSDIIVLAKENTRLKRQLMMAEVMLKPGGKRSNFYGWMETHETYAMVVDKAATIEKYKEVERKDLGSIRMIDDESSVQANKGKASQRRPSNYLLS
ncbi:hypothetical protein ACFE04_002783 [Oxalis oulophora]